MVLQPNSVADNNSRNTGHYQSSHKDEKRPARASQYNENQSKSPYFTVENDNRNLTQGSGVMKVQLKKVVSNDI